MQRAALQVEHAAVLAQLRWRLFEQGRVGHAAEVVPLQPEQAQAGLVGGDQGAVAEREQAFVRGAEQRRIVVHAQQFALGDGVVEIAVLDAGHRPARQAQRVHVLHAGIAGNVQHAGQLAVGIEDRHCGAAEDLVRRKIVFAAAHFHRTALDDGGADRVGADLGLAPARARHQRHAPGLVQEARAAFGVEDPAGRVGQQHDAAGGGGIAGQAFQFGAGQPPQAFVRRAQFAQARCADRFDRRRTQRRQAQALAALPRLQDGVRHLADRGAAALEEDPARVAELVLRLRVCHDGSAVADCDRWWDRWWDRCSDKHHIRRRRAIGTRDALQQECSLRAHWPRRTAMTRRNSENLASLLR